MLKSLIIRNFRNLSVPKVQLSPGYTVIVGENGQGKTNLLEAIYLLAYGKPLRGSKDEVINWNEDEAVVAGETESSKIQIVFRRSRETQVFLNNKLKSVSNIFGKFLAVVFCPQEVELISGSPVLRRNFLDRLISTSNRDYLFNLLSYERALGHKNRLLKEQASSTSLESWDKQLAAFGSKIWLVREQTAQALNQILKSESLRLVGKPVSLKYKSPIVEDSPKEAEKKFLQRLLAQKDLERRYLATIFGPHRDDFKVIMEETRDKTIIEKDLAVFGSRGEQRQGVILCKLACAKLFSQLFHQTASLLLDDVAGELDENNRRLLLANLPTTQAIVTTASLEVLPEEIRKKAAVLTVKEGKLLAS
jgi:DNA replication and repair protein RecF